MYDGTKFKIQGTIYMQFGKTRRYLGSRTLVIGKKAPKIGRDIIILHGIYNNNKMWLPFVAPHLKRHRFFLIDLAGFASSRKTSFSNSMNPFADYAQVVRSIIQQEQLQEPKVVAFSMGAFSMLQYFEMFGSDGIKSYMHIDHSACPVNIDNWDGAIDPHIEEKSIKIVEKYEPYFDHHINDICPRVIKQLGKDVFAFKTSILQRSTSIDLVRSFIQKSARLPFNEKLQSTFFHNPINAFFVMKAYGDRSLDFRDIISEIKVPITLLVGCKNPLFELGWVRQFESMARDVKTVLFQDAGHDLIMKSPNQFYKNFTDFISAH